MAIPTLLRRLIWLLVLAAIVTVAVIFVLKRRGAERTPPTAPPPVDRGDITMTVTATGTLSAVTTVQVGSQVSGIIRALYADFNTAVRAGQVLAELDPTPFEAQVEQRRADVVQAEVQLRNAEIAFHRQERLLAAGLTSQAEYDAAEAAADGARGAGRPGAGGALPVRDQPELHGDPVADRRGGGLAAVRRRPDRGRLVPGADPVHDRPGPDQDAGPRPTSTRPTSAGSASARSRASPSTPTPRTSSAARITQVRLNATINQNVVTYPVIIEVANPDDRLRPEMTADVTIEVATVP